MKNKLARVSTAQEKNINKGITLIALVVTIIVLLILAGVTISSIVRNDGIIDQTNEARDKTKYGADKEELEIVAVRVKNKSNENVDYEELQKELPDWTIDTSMGQITSPNGNVFNLYEFIEDNHYLDPNEWYYEPDTAILLKYRGNESNLIIPNRIKTENGDVIVKKIGNATNNIWHNSICDEIGAYGEYPSFITTVTISEGIEEISNQAFSGSENITTVVFPSSLKLIGDYAFAGCYGLKEVDLLNCKKITEIDDYSFLECKSLKKYILPKSIVTIKNVITLGSAEKIYYEGSMEDWDRIEIDERYKQILREKVVPNYKK